MLGEKRDAAVRVAPLIAIVAVGLLWSTGCDRSRQQAREVLERWLAAHVAKDFAKVVSLTADATFADVARQQKVPIAQVRADMPKLFALAPEKLTGFELAGEGRELSEGCYGFVVVQKTVKQGKRASKRETVHVVREGDGWRVDPTRTRPAPND